MDRQFRNRRGKSKREKVMFGFHHHDHHHHRHYHNFWAALKSVMPSISTTQSCMVTFVLILCQLLSFTSLQQHPSSSSYFDQSFSDGEIDFGILDQEYYTSRPQNVTFKAVGTDSIAISWKPPSYTMDDPVIGYKIKFRMKGSKKQESVTHMNATHCYYVLKNLEKSTTYNVKLAAMFSNETGPYTDWFTVETLSKDLDESRVPDKPSSLRAKAEGTSIYVTWSPPKHSNIVVRGYVIGWGEGLPDRYQQVINGDHLRSYTIENVTLSTEYVISLRAQNLRGEGQPIYESVKTSASVGNDDDDPFDPKTFMLPPIGLTATIISSNTAVLHWDDTNRHLDPNPENRWFLVRYTSNFLSSSPRYRYTNTTKLSCLIEDLKPNTQYEFAAKLIKNKRNSTWSMSVYNTTFQAVPSTPPRDLTVVPSPDDDPSIVHLHWQPPKYPNGPVNGYVIFFTMDNTQEDRDWKVKTIMDDRLNTVLHNLQPSSTYFFKIQARNSKGYGPLSPEVSFHTLPSRAVLATSKDNDESNWFNIGIFAVVIILLLILISYLVMKIHVKNENDSNTSKSLKNRKGYVPTATSPSGKNTNSRLNNNLKPPDLWIHGQNEQVEMKLMDKNNGDNDSSANTNSARIVHDNSFAKIKKTNSTYGVNSALYDDINKSPSSPVDNMGMATMRRSSSIRPKATSCMDHPIMNGMINLEPSTGLSRPLFPNAKQLNLGHMDNVDSSTMPFNGNNLHLYAPVSGSAAHIALANLHHENQMPQMHQCMNNSYMSSGNSSSPHSVISNNTVLTNSSTGTNITNSSTSPPNTSIYLSNNRPKPNPVGVHSALKSFGVPTPPPPLPSLASLSGLQNNSHSSIYNGSIASPSKKFLLTTTNNLTNNICGGSNSTLASNSKSATNYSDDNSISASQFNADIPEMTQLNNLMKEAMNAMKPNHGLES